MAEGVAAAPESAVETPIPSADDASLSLADHERQFGEHRQETAAEPETRPVETPEPEPDATDGAAPAEPDTERDEKGRFKPKRHRAESAIATSADVPRIRELTARLRATEAERDALKAQTSVSRATPPPPPTPIAAPAKPTPDQFDDYGAYVEALTDWKTDQKIAAAEQKRQQTEQQSRAEAEAKRIERSFEERKAAARLKYPDFDEVAIDAPTLIPRGSLVDAWILEHKTGADVLYHLQRHPDELATLLQQPVLEQAESLALLAQRFNGHGRTAAAATGSAPTSPSTPPPKPPNPVRTGPLRSGDEPPGETASLADHEKYWQPRRRRG